VTLPVADSLLFGLLVGFTLGRLGCSLVHDHPGITTDAQSWLALGPWPCACSSGGADASCCATPVYRYDLGLLELFVCVALLLWSRFVFDWRRAAHGRLLGWTAVLYGLARFPLDRLRVADLEHFGLTFAQWASIAFVAIGLRLLWSTRGRPPRAA